MTRECIRCKKPFEPAASIEAKLQSSGRFQKVCSLCVMNTINDICCESIEHMTDEEIEAELREDGVDVEAFIARMHRVLAGPTE